MLSDVRQIAFLFTIFPLVYALNDLIGSECNRPCPLLRKEAIMGCNLIQWVDNFPSILFCLDIHETPPHVGHETLAGLLMNFPRQNTNRLSNNKNMLVLFRWIFWQPGSKWYPFSRYKNHELSLNASRLGEGDEQEMATNTNKTKIP